MWKSQDERVQRHDCKIKLYEEVKKNIQQPDFKGMLRRNIEHFLKKRKYEKLGFSEMN